MRILKLKRDLTVMGLLLMVILALVLSGCSGPPGPSGVGITGASINNDGHLILTLSNGETLDAGIAVAPPVTTTIQSVGSPLTMGDLFALVRPVIVRVNVSGLGFRGSGSGIIIRNDGYIITNEHVVDDAGSINITLSDDRQYPATVIASDAAIDLALLQLSGSPANLPAATLGTASDIIIGGIVIAAGFPLGQTLPGPASFTQGIVSAMRTLGSQEFVQTDVAINPGSSGGALINRTNGRVIGVTSAAILPEGEPVTGIGLAIPIDVVQTFIQNNLPQ